MLKNMKIGKKLFITYILIAVISSVSGIIGLGAMNNISTQYSSALSQYGFSQGNIGLFSAEFNHSCAIIRDTISLTNLMEMEASASEFARSNVNINSYLSKMEKDMVTDREKKLYQSIKADAGSFQKLSKDIIEQSEQGNKSEAKKILDDQCTPLANDITASISTLISSKNVSGSQVAAELAASQRMADIFILVLILASFAAACLAAVWISRGISKPVKRMAQAARKMTEGDLNVELNYHSEDEIGELSASFDSTAQALKSYITDIKTNLARVAEGDLNISLSDHFKGDFIELKDSITDIVNSFNEALLLIGQASRQVSAGSGQVSDSAQALAQGATEQASSVEELTAAVEEISTHVKANAEYTDTVSKHVAVVSEEIDASNQLMAEMTEAMGNIDKASGEISKIIRAIDDIAFQTNILALNAAVEAARAGSAGRGFAVVADEVRNLASKSAEAAKNTAALIENSIRQVKDGTQIAGVTAESLTRVMESAKNVTETVGHISESSAKQSNAIQQVTLGLEQISAVVQTNSATAEESAAASQELSDQARALEELLNRFRLRDAMEAEGTPEDPGAGPAEDESPAPQAENTPEESQQTGTPKYQF